MLMQSNKKIDLVQIIYYPNQPSLEALSYISQLANTYNINQRSDLYDIIRFIFKPGNLRVRKLGKFFNKFLHFLELNKIEYKLNLYDHPHSLSVIFKSIALSDLNYICLNFNIVKIPHSSEIFMITEK